MLITIKADKSSEPLEPPEPQSLASTGELTCTLGDQSRRSAPPAGPGWEPSGLLHFLSLRMGEENVRAGCLIKVLQQQKWKVSGGQGRTGQWLWWFHDVSAQDRQYGFSVWTKEQRDVLGDTWEGEEQTSCVLFIIQESLELQSQNMFPIHHFSKPSSSRTLGYGRSCSLPPVAYWGDAVLHVLAACFQDILKSLPGPPPWPWPSPWPWPLFRWDSFPTIDKQRN